MPDRNIQIVLDNAIIICGHDIVIKKVDDKITFDVDGRNLLRWNDGDHKMKKLILFQCDNNINIPSDVRKWFDTRQIKITVMGIE